MIISSLPINITSKYLGKKNKLKYRGICSVYLFYNKNQILPKTNTGYILIQSLYYLTELQKIKNYLVL